MKAFLLYSEVFSTEDKPLAILAAVLPEQCLSEDEGTYILMRSLDEKWGTLLSFEETTYLSIKYGLKYDHDTKAYLRLLSYNLRYESPDKAVSSTLLALSRLKGVRGIVYHVDEEQNTCSPVVNLRACA